MKHFLYLFVVFISLTITAQDNNSLTVEFDGIKADSGKLFVALYDTEVDFLKKQFQGLVVDIHEGKAKAVFNNLKHGIYAVSSFFDKNDNGKMDTNFLGIPKEPTGMSNNAKGSFGPPKFKDAKFSISEDQNYIKIKFN